MKRQGGFTLIELLITVAVIGILAALAVFQFTKDVRKAKSAEVGAMFAELELKENAYHGENGVFLETGSSESDTFPSAPAAGGSAQPLGDLPQSWADLKIAPASNHLYCAYVIITGRGGDGSNIGPKASEFDMVDTPNRDWYYLLARCDFDADSAVDEFHFKRSDRARTEIQNRGN